jgi:hypothetical protein
MGACERATEWDQGKGMHLLRLISDLSASGLMLGLKTNDDHGDDDDWLFETTGDLGKGMCWVLLVIRLG